MVCFAFTFSYLWSHVDIYSLHEGYFTYAFLDCVHDNKDFAKSRFIISRFCSIHFIVILDGLKKIVCYTEDFIIQRFVKSRFHCSRDIRTTPKRASLTLLAPIAAYKFSKLISIHFLTELVGRIWKMISAFFLWWSFCQFSWPLLLIAY